jgi:hypothetical protein
MGWIHDVCVKMGLDAMTYIRSFMKIDAVIQKLMRGYADSVDMA